MLHRAEVKVTILEAAVKGCHECSFAVHVGDKFVVKQKRGDRGPALRVVLQWSFSSYLKADLHDATSTHATSLRQAYDMISDHLHAHDIFTYEIKYAKVCTRIFGAKVLRNGNRIF